MTNFRLDGFMWCCQTNMNGFRSRCICALSGGAKLPPLRESGGAVFLEYVAAVEMTVLVEVVVDRRVNGGKSLKGPHLSKSLHGPLLGRSRRHRFSGVRHILPSSGCAPSAEHELQDGLLADRAAGKHFRDDNREP